MACPDLSPVGEAIDGAEWVLHAATQDLPCLAEVGMRPARLFDTELGARLAGLPRVGLGAVVEEQLGLSLAKEHSAVDWSTRPLPEAWLRYAALDVEVLVDLRDAIAELLESQGKLVWAEQEFAAIADAPPPAPRVDPWRRTSGTHRLRTRRQLAMLRELWTTRDELAPPARRLARPGAGRLRARRRGAGVAPHHGGARRRGRLHRPAARRNGARWLEALARARKTPDADLPRSRFPMTPLLRRGPGPTATRTPRPGSPTPRPSWPGCRRSWRCRSRTS